MPLGYCAAKSRSVFWCSAASSAASSIHPNVRFGVISKTAVGFADPKQKRAVWRRATLHCCEVVLDGARIVASFVLHLSERQ